MREYVLTVFAMLGIPFLFVFIKDVIVILREGKAKKKEKKKN